MVSVLLPLMIKARRSTEIAATIHAVTAASVLSGRMLRR
jgi:hypothetical protein